MVVYSGELDDCWVMCAEAAQGGNLVDDLRAKAFSIHCPTLHRCQRQYLATNASAPLDQRDSLPLDIGRGACPTTFNVINKRSAATHLWWGFVAGIILSLRSILFSTDLPAAACINDYGHLALTMTLYPRCWTSDSSTKATIYIP
jgi:hypothetical protein